LGGSATGRELTRRFSMILVCSGIGIIFVMRREYFCQMFAKKIFFIYIWYS